MLMPKAPVYENYGAIFWQNDIRSPRKRLVVQTEAKAHAMQQGADKNFRPRVFAVDLGH
jgi:hypothetical protein